MDRTIYDSVPRGYGTYGVISKARKLARTVNKLRREIKWHRWFIDQEPRNGWAEYQQYLAFIHHDAMKIVDLISEAQEEVSKLLEDRQNSP